MSDKSMIVFSVKPAWIYRSNSGEMRETHLQIDFLADTYGEAIHAGIKWARNRHDNIMKDLYEDCSLGSIKIGCRRISTPSEDGYISTTYLGSFFEWKCGNGYPTPEDRARSCEKNWDLYHESPEQ